MRVFAGDNGLEPVIATSREKAIMPLLKDLASQPLDRVKEIVQNITNESGEDRTLEGWAGVILDKKRRD